MGLHGVRTARSEICPICKADASVIADQYSGYQDTYCYRILECEYCDLQFVDPMIVPPGLYDGIYRNSDRLPGYKRYREYRDLIARSKDKSSLSWLAAQEPAYWFVCSELAALSPSARILEVGSGLGYLTYAIHSAGYNIIGIDISNDAITEARSSFGGFYLHKDLNALALEEPNSFDAVIMTEVIEHVPTPRTFLDAAASLLKPGGQIILTTPNKSNAPLGVCWDTESPPVHLWWFSETAMRRLAQNSCLSIRMGDFRSMYQGRKPYSVPPTKSGPPPFLDSSGQVTDAAKRWQAGRLWLTNLENHSGKLRPFVKTVRRVKRSYPALLQRNWQMGVVLAKRPAVRGDGM
jgi:SAM-dependent methyltransferase